MRKGLQKRLVFLVSLLLWVGLLFAASSVGISHEAKALSADYTRRAPTKRDFDAAMPNCIKSGLVSAVEARTSSNVDDQERATLIAIAIYESTCIPFPPNSIGCVGWYQVCPGKGNSQFNNLSKKYSLTGSDLVHKLSTDAAFATLVAQKDILAYWRTRSSNEIGAFCGYAGFKNPGQYSPSNMCNSAANYLLLKNMVMGKEFSSETIADIEDPHYGDTEFKNESGEVIARTLNCQDKTGKLAQSLAQMARKYHLTSAVQTQEQFFEGLQAAETAGRIRDESSLKSYCIDKVFASWDVGQALMDGAAWLTKWIKSVITTAMNALCSYIISFVSSTIDTLMNSICLNISMPSFSVGLGSLKTKGCNGISLGKALVTTTSGSGSGVVNAVQDAISDAAYPVINAIPTMGITIQNPPIFPIRRLYGTTSSGDDDFH